MPHLDHLRMNVRKRSIQILDNRVLRNAFIVIPLRNQNLSSDNKTCAIIPIKLSPNNQLSLPALSNIAKMIADNIVMLFLPEILTKPVIE